MLSELYFPISVIGVTERKLKNDRQIFLNINITGYSFLSQPSYTNTGGVGFYIKNHLGYIHTSDKMILNHTSHRHLYVFTGCRLSLESISRLLCSVSRAFMDTPPII